VRGERHNLVVGLDRESFYFFERVQQLNMGEKIEEKEIKEQKNE
jgi:hypothetical protein